jgi:hypothetical protein
MIRSELDVLLDKVRDPALREDLRVHIDRLKQRGEGRGDGDRSRHAALPDLGPG